MYITKEDLRHITLKINNGIFIIKRKEVVLTANGDGLYYINHIIKHLSAGDIKWCLQYGSIDTTKYIYPNPNGNVKRIPKSTLVKTILKSDIDNKRIIVYTDGTFYSGGIHRRDLRVIKGIKGNYICRNNVFYYTKKIKEGTERTERALSYNIEIKGFRTYYLHKVAKRTIVDRLGNVVKPHGWRKGIRQYNLHGQIVSFNEIKKLVFHESYWGEEKTTNEDIREIITDSLSNRVKKKNKHFIMRKRRK